MRRGLASLIIGLSLLLASVSWAGFTLSRTVLDPGRSERLADQLLDNPQVRDALVSRLADSLEAQLPSEVPIPRQVVEGGAATALDDPRVEALIRDGFVRVHQNALAGSTEPVVVDANALGAAGRDVLVATRPELDPLLPAAPALELELPTTGLAWLGTVKDLVDRFTLWTGLAAVSGAVIAFAVARDRAVVLRRVAYWGYGTAVFWLAVGYAVPWIAGALSPTSAAIAAAVVDVFFGAMIQPALVLVAFATALLLISLLLPATGRRRGAAVLQPRRSAGHVAVSGAGQSAQGVQPHGAGAGYGAVPAAPVVRRHDTAEIPRTVVPGHRSPSLAPSAVGTTTATTGGDGRDRTEVMGRPAAGTAHPPAATAPAWHEPAPAPHAPTGTSGWDQPEPTPPAPQWRKGYGYLDDHRSSPFDGDDIDAGRFPPTGHWSDGPTDDDRPTGDDGDDDWFGGRAPIDR